MNYLQWVTPQGTVANATIGLPFTVKLLATDPLNPGAALTYRVINGSLPAGVTLATDGTITGTPDYSNINTSYANSATFNFIVRVISSDGSAPVDGSFNLIVTNVVDNNFTWVTPSGNLGTVPNGEFYQLPLAVNTNGANVTVTYTHISGELPPGMEVANGNLQGVPTLLEATAVDTAQEFRFTIRATTSQGHIRDQSFTLSVTNVYGPVIEPTTTYLGSFFDGSYFSRQLYVNELNPNVSISWSNIGSLPTGVTLSSTGLLSGYIYPLPVEDVAQSGYDTETVSSGVVIYEQEYDQDPYDFVNNVTRSLSYNFTIQAYDGANYDLQDYTINVVSRGDYTADNNIVTIDNSYITVDSGNVYYPVILNGNVTTLPPGRSGAYYAYKFDGYDFQGDTITYSLSSSVGTFDAQVPDIDNGFDYGSSDTSTLPNPSEHINGVPFDSFDGGTITNLPFGLFLTPDTGWLYGQLGEFAGAEQTFTFGVTVSKTRDGNVYTSPPSYFKITVSGQVNNTIEWITDSNLGVITNGTVSNLLLEATSINDKPLVYSLLDKQDVSVRLPQGLKLLPSGEISGRVSFESFSIDNSTTTFDGGALTIDRTYNFTANVVTTDGTAFATKDFTITLGVNDINPYDNLYLRALPSVAQRQAWHNIINDSTIFDPALIYRPNDQWFGINDSIEMLFLPGLTASDLDTYANAIAQNHYTKTFTFGDVDSAVVLDENYNVKYEVVYVNVNDPEENADGTGPGLELDLNGIISNPYIAADGTQYKVMYPNTSTNMISRLTTNVGYYDQSTLPEWMTSNQPGETSDTFTPPLGFTRAVVLAYTKPGTGKLIAYRLRNSNFNFGEVEFTVDRYFLDDYLTSNFNTVTNKFYGGRETTFDSLLNQNVGAIVATVEYAVQTPFSQINGRPVEYVNARTGIDGATNYQNGDTLIFAQQENFLSPGPYEGWVSYGDAFIGDNIYTPEIEGYSSGGYDTYSIIPGYLEKAQGISPVNQRGGIWRINIVNGIINLSFVKEIEPNQKIRVLFGTTYAGAILYYNQTLSASQTVPFYKVFTAKTNATATRTTFNNDSTKFFSYRDQYYSPGDKDKYVKFPQYGAFN